MLRFELHHLFIHFFFLVGGGGGGGGGKRAPLVTAKSATKENLNIFLGLPPLRFRSITAL